MFLLMLGLLQQTDKQMTQNRRGQPPTHRFTASKTAHFQQTMGFLASNFKTSRNRALKHALPPYRLTCRAFADP